MNRDLSHPKRESYPWTTVPLVWLRLVNLLKPYALILSFYHEFVSAGVNDSSQCGLSELQILSASVNFDTLCRKPIVQLREMLDRDRRELIQELLAPWARPIRQDHSATDPAPALLCIFSVSDLVFSSDNVVLHASMFPCKLDCPSFSSRQLV